MKSVKETLLERRSIRRYERQQVSDDDMRFIYEAIRNAPTSVNGQQFTVIDVTDWDTKLQIEALTEQKQVKTCSHFLVFCADYHKFSILAQEQGYDVPAATDTVEGLMVGVVDATLAMMSAVTAAGSLGLGTCCIGYARTAAPEELAQILKLPQGVFVVCGLAIGIPAEMPDLKPKEPIECVVQKERYQEDAYLLPLMEKYNDQIKYFNETRTGDQADYDWVQRIHGYYERMATLDMLSALKKRGFDPKR